MKIINTSRCCCMFMLWAFSAAQAGGGLIPEEITAIGTQKPDLWAFLTSALDIGGGSARRIGSDENTDLAGTRILPYHLLAKPKGTEGPYIYEIELQGTTTYFDKRERKSTLKRAASVKMTFTGISLHKLTSKEQQ